MGSPFMTTFDVIVKLTSSSASSLNNLVGASYDFDCERNIRGSVKSVNIISDGLYAASSGMYEEGIVRKLAKFTGALGIITFAAKVINRNEKLTWSDTLGFLSAAFTMANKFNVVGMVFSFASIGLTFIDLSEEGYPKGSNDKLCNKPPKPTSHPNIDDAERTVSPLVIDLNKGGIETTFLRNGVFFDLDNSLFAEKTAWLNRNDGFLALDLNSNGKIDNGAELFGNHTVLQDGTLAADGFAALRQYDTNADGVISAQDAIWSQLKVWQDRNYNGKTDADELSSLSDLGIASINLQAQQVHETDDANNDISHRSQVTWTDGTQSDIEDVWFKVNTADSRYTGAVDIPEDVATLPDVHGFGNVPNLQIAMSKDSKLKAMVEEYIAADEAKRESLLDALIYRWTGSEDVDPYSRDPKKIYGHVMDARQLVTLEHLTGHGYLGTWCWGERDPNPHGHAAPKLIAEYQKFANYVRAAIADQVDYGGLFSPENTNSPLIWTIVDQLLTQAYENGDETRILSLVQHMEDLGAYYGDYQTTLASHLEALSNERGGIFSALINHRYYKGTEVADKLLGTDKDEAFDGRGGNDLLQGGAGNDIYRFSGKFGDDRIYDSAGNDSIVFTDASITAQNISFTRDVSNVTIHTPQGTIQLDNFFNFDGSVYQGRIEKLQFADGSTVSWEDIVETLKPNPTEQADKLYYTAEADNISALAGDDEIYAGDGANVIDAGAGNDTVYAGNDDDSITGGYGDDVLNGANGADTYHYRLGDGNDTIVDHFEATGHNNRLVLHELSKDDIQMARVNGDDLRITIKQTEHTITVKNYFNGQAITGYVFDRIEFDDNTAFETDEIRTLVQQGTEQNDTLYGYSTDDVLHGGADNDILYGNDGDDILDGGEGADRIDGGEGSDSITGGKGSDTLNGGAGDDTYIYRLGDGSDTITNKDENSGGTDTLKLEGISQAQVTAARDGNTLLLHLADGAIISVTDYFDGSDASSNAIDVIAFADGQWDIAAVKEKVQISSGQNDKLYGYDRADSLDGGAGNDELYGYGGDDTLNGSEGADRIDGGAGNDSITGGKGSDTLNGGAGDDTYYYRYGDGNDTINNYGGGTDTLALQGLTPAQVTASRDGGSLILTQDNGQTITVNGYFDTHGATNAALAQITFDSSAEVWTPEIIKAKVQETTERNDKLYGYDGADTLDGGAGNDQLFGYAGNDTLSGGEGNDYIDGGEGNDLLADGEGNDTLRGGSGSDTYIYRHGDGNDTIINSGNTDGDRDTLQFADIRSDAVRAVRVNDNLVLHLDNGQHITVQDYFANDAEGKDTLQSIAFADGKTWDVAAVKTLVQQGTEQADTLYGYRDADTLDGGAGDDTLYGRAGNDELHGGLGSDRLYGEDGEDRLYGDNGADSLYGGKGNDRLEGGNGNDTLSGGQGDDALLGGAGNDTYIFHSGDGHDTILHASLTDYETNTLRLQDIAPETVNLKSDGDDLLIVMNATKESVRVQGYFAEGAEKRGIDRIVFDNGTVWQESDIAQHTLHETDGDDVLVGSVFDDVIDAKGGNDSITGGKGNDTLNGGEGDDTYYYQLGDGHDTITDIAGDDRIIFGAGIRREDVSFSRVDNHLLVSVNGDAAITITDWFTDADHRIEHFQFADQTEWRIDDLKAMNIPSQFADGDDVVQGWDGIDTIDGGAGDDQLFGNGGSDTLIGGLGSDVLDGGADADTLIGGKGDDTYRIDSQDTIIEKADEGYDTVETDSSFTLVNTNLEAVTLLGDKDADATGNDADNRLTGNSGNNRLDGGAGADIMQGGAGDDYYVVDRYDSVAQDSSWSSYLVAGDKVIEAADGGIDTIERHADPFIISKDSMGNPVNTGQYADLEDHVENLILKGSAAAAYGNALDNDIVLNEADNIVNARGGSDTIHYQIGGGKDEMNFLDNTTARDSLHISGVNDKDANVRRSGDDIVITFNNDAHDQITLKDHFKASTNNGSSVYDSKVDSIVFDDNGREWTTDYLEYLAQGGTHSTAPTAVNNTRLNAIEAETLTANLNDYFTDREGDALHFTVSTADGSALPDWLHIDLATGAISGKPPIGAADLTLNVTASEASSLSASTTVDLVIADNQAPRLLRHPDDIAVTEAVAFTISLPDNLFTDPEGHALSYTLTAQDGTALPAWLQFDADTRTLSGTAPADVSTLGLRLQATDAANLHSETAFALNIAPNQAPVLVLPYNDIRINEGENLQQILDLSRFNDPEGSSLTFTLTQSNGDALPAWLSFDEQTGQLSGQAPLGSQDLSLKIQAQDSAGKRSADNFDLHINAAPQLQGDLGAQAAAEGKTWRYYLPLWQFKDPENGALSYRITMNDGAELPSWMHYDEHTHAITAEVPIGQDDFTLSITATDAYGLSKTGSIPVSITHTDRELHTPWNGGTVIGESGNDKLYGSWFNDVLSGGKGDDTLIGLIGSDLLIGGKSNDLLQGGLGSDTYQYQKGDGQDIIDDEGGVNDTLILQNYRLEDIRLERKNNDQILHFAGSDDTITIKDRYAAADKGRIEHFVFDNETMDYRGFEAKVQAYSAGGNRDANDRSAAQANQLVNAMASFGSGAAAPADAPNSLGADAALLAASAVNDPNKLVS